MGVVATLVLAESSWPNLSSKTWRLETLILRLGFAPEAASRRAELDQRNVSYLCINPTNNEKKKREESRAAGMVIDEVSVCCHA